MGPDQHPAHCGKIKGEGLEPAEAYASYAPDIRQTYRGLFVLLHEELCPVSNEA